MENQSRISCRICDIPTRNNTFYWRIRENTFPTCHNCNSRLEVQRSEAAFANLDLSELPLSVELDVAEVQHPEPYVEAEQQEFAESVETVQIPFPPLHAPPPRFQYTRPSRQRKSSQNPRSLLILIIILGGLSAATYFLGPKALKAYQDYLKTHTAPTPTPASVPTPSPVPKASPQPTEAPTPTSPPPEVPTPAPVATAVPVTPPSSTPDLVSGWVPPAPGTAYPVEWITKDGARYYNVNVMQVDPDRVVIGHSDGVTEVEISMLIPQIQKLLNYDPVLAGQAKAKRALMKIDRANAAIDDDLLPTPTTTPP